MIRRIIKGSITMVGVSGASGQDPQFHIELSTTEERFRLLTVELTNEAAAQALLHHRGGMPCKITFYAAQPSEHIFEGNGM